MCVLENLIVWFICCLKNISKILVVFHPNREVIAMIGGLNDKPPLNLKVELSLTEEERARRRREKDLEQQYQQEVMLLGCAYIHILW